MSSCFQLHNELDKNIRRMPISELVEMNENKIQPTTNSKNMIDYLNCELQKPRYLLTHNQTFSWNEFSRSSLNLWCSDASYMHIKFIRELFTVDFQITFTLCKKIRISLASNTNSLCKIYSEPSSIVFYASLRFSSIIFTFFGHCLFPCFQLGIFFQIFFRNMSPSIFSNLQRYICRTLW